MNAPVIVASNLHKSFPEKAVLRGVDLAIPRGAVVGLLGANGSGKSTFIKCLLGLLKPSEGEVRLWGEDPWWLSESNKARLGFVPQEIRLYPWMTVSRLTRYWGAFYPNWDHAWVESLLDTWELDRKAKVGTLSAGQLQRVALVLAVGHHPELLVLDEPVAALDPVGRREFLRSLVEMTQDGEHTVLFSTHILSDLERVASHVALLADGKVQCFDELDVLKDRFKRLRIRADRDLPYSFSIPGSIRMEIHGSEAIVTITDCDEALLSDLRVRWNAEIDVDDLNLEEIFLELHGRPERGPNPSRTVAAH